MALAGAPERTELVTAKTVSQLAEMPAVRQCLQWLAAEKHRINEEHLELCRIPAPTFQEQRRAEFIASRLRAYGWDAKIDRAGNVIAPLNGNREGTLVALTAHLDTVLEPRNPEEVNVGRDGRFYGPGVADNGAGLAALLAIARALRDSALPRSVLNQFVFIANVGEEGEGNLSGMRFLCRPGGLAARIRAFLILDGPALDHITWRALASRRFEITITGPGGHSWSDYGTGNPVHALGRAIALCAAELAPACDSPRSSFNFGILEGGASVNSIPTLARAKLDLRSESMQRVDEMAQVLTSCVERALEAENHLATAGRVSAKIREIGSRPGGQLAEGAQILSFVRAVDSYLGVRAVLDCASTDANVPLSLGMQAVSIGAGGQGGGAHTPLEWYHPDGREVGLRRILLSMLLLAGFFPPPGQ